MREAVDLFTVQKGGNKTHTDKLLARFALYMYSSSPLSQPDDALLLAVVVFSCRAIATSLFRIGANGGTPYSGHSNLSLCLSGSPVVPSCAAESYNRATSRSLFERIRLVLLCALHCHRRSWLTRVSRDAIRRAPKDCHLRSETSSAVRGPGAARPSNGAQGNASGTHPRRLRGDAQRVRGHSECENSFRARPTSPGCSSGRESIARTTTTSTGGLRLCSR